MFGKKINRANQQDVQTAIDAMKKGSAEAFHLLYSRYHQKVYRFCLRMLGDEAAAKDAFQETFIKVYEHRESFRGSNFSGWLFTIARHTCLNVIRAKKTHDSFDEVFHSTGYSKESDVALKDHIKKAIAVLPITLRESLILREYEECSYKDISNILGIELSLAKVRVHRARLILRKLLTPLVKELNESQ